MRQKSELVFLLFRNWREARKLTLDWIENIPENLLNKKLPRIGLNTFTKQILEMSEVEASYSRALVTNQLDFSNVVNKKGSFRKITKIFLKRILLDSDKNLLKTSKKIVNWDEKIKIFGNFVPKYAILELLTRHETFHHGQFAAYGFLLGLKFPKSWVQAWAIPQTNVAK